MDKPRLLLSACCGPCSTVALERLCEKYNITLLFYGDNLDTATEYVRRLTALQTVNREMNDGKEMVILEYRPDNFHRVVRDLQTEPEGGKRCEICFKLRLHKTAEIVKQGNYDLFATTLTVSPHKNAELINQIGLSVADDFGIKYLPTDLQKDNGFARSVEISKQLNLYRQKYCGCGFFNGGTTVGGDRITN
jgi:predicted adenine nucleotide alpha hydrolase (AANH) superfamily ATPase